MPRALQLPRRRLGGEIIGGRNLLAQFGLTPKSKRELIAGDDRQRRQNS